MTASAIDLTCIKTLTGFFVNVVWPDNDFLLSINLPTAYAPTERVELSAMEEKIDLDGTILSSQHTIEGLVKAAERSIELLREAKLTLKTLGLDKGRKPFDNKGVPHFVWWWKGNKFKIFVGDKEDGTPVVMWYENWDHRLVGSTDDIELLATRLVFICT